MKTAAIIALILAVINIAFSFTRYVMMTFDIDSFIVNSLLLWPVLTLLNGLPTVILSLAIISFAARNDRHG